MASYVSRSTPLECLLRLDRDQQSDEEEEEEEAKCFKNISFASAAADGKRRN
jgi:hypothetical protein